MGRKDLIYARRTKGQDCEWREVKTGEANQDRVEAGARRARHRRYVNRLRELELLSTFLNPIRRRRQQNVNIRRDGHSKNSRVSHSVFE